MTNTERIQANNAELREAIELAESLPDAGAVVGTEPYEGEYIVTPKVEAQTMPTKEKVMFDDVTIKAIPYVESENSAGGTTVTIA